MNILLFNKKRDYLIADDFETLIQVSTVTTHVHVLYMYCTYLYMYIYIVHVVPNVVYSGLLFL